MLTSAEGVFTWLRISSCDLNCERTKMWYIQKSNGKSSISWVLEHTKTMDYFRFLINDRDILPYQYSITPIERKINRKQIKHIQHKQKIDKT